MTALTKVDKDVLQRALAAARSAWVHELGNWQANRQFPRWRMGVQPIRGQAQHQNPL